MITGLLAMIAMGLIGYAGENRQAQEAPKLKQPEQLKRCILEGKRITCWRHKAYKEREGKR